MMEFLAELFQFLKDDAVKVLHSMPTNLENSGMATGLEKVSFHYNWKERKCQRVFKLPHNCTHLHTSKVMLNILQARLQQYLNWEFSDVHAGLKKAEEPEIKLLTCIGSQNNQQNSRKTSTSAWLTTLQPLTVWVTTNCGKFLKRWEYQIPYLPPVKTVCRSRSNS